MICPKCGTENPAKFKFCVGCGCNLADPSEVNIEQVDMGGYRSEEDYGDDNKNGFKIGSGTFTISDSAPDTSSGMFTADELNDTDEEFDFSSFDEPYIPKLDADRITVPGAAGGRPQNAPQPQAAQNMGQFSQQGMPQQNMYGGFPQQQAAGMQSSQQPVPNPQGGMPQQGMPGQQPMGMNPYMNQMYGGQPIMYGQPQIVGYDQNGMPIYGQPQMMYGQPQIVGYDQNGMPIYGQPQMMYAQPQIVGYDQNGMPIYGQPQPMMYGQPQMMGENGEPISQQNPYQMSQQGMQQPYGMPAMGMPGQPQMGGMYGAPPQMQQQFRQPQPQQPKEDKKVKVPNQFWDDFFSDSNGGSGDKNGGDQDDFFGKSRSSDMGGVSAEGMDLSRLKKHERRKNSYMTDTPSVNADELQPNKKDEINKLYMRKTAMVNADELEAKKTEKTQDIMGVTNDVNADDLETYEHKKTKVVMVNAGQADAEQLEVYTHEHQESIMAEADHAVEALPKKKVIVDEIDAIELPEHMQAKKTKKEDTAEIPSLPEV